MKNEDIKPLTDEEVETLQTDSALRKIGALDKVILELNRELAEKLNEFGKAKIALEIAKSRKELVIERMRNLKNFVKGGQINL